MRHNPLHINRHHIPEEGMDICEKVDAAKLNFDIEQAAVSPVSLDLHAALAGEDLIVRGKASVDFESTCDRCLCQCIIPIVVDDVCQMIEQCPDLVDLTDMIREDILVTFPQTSLCKSDCEGLCSGCGVDLNQEDCQCLEENDEEPQDGENDEGSNPFADALKDFKI